MTDTPQSKPLFQDPFHGLGEYTPQTHGRIQCDIPKDLHRRFYKILPDRSDAVFQTTYAILTVKLLEALEKLSISDFTQADEYKQFITNLQLVDGRTKTNGRTKRKL